MRPVCVVGAREARRRSSQWGSRSEALGPDASVWQSSLDASGATLAGFVHDNVAAGATVHTDAWKGYQSPSGLGYDHQPRNQSAARRRGADPDEILPRVHRSISNLKSWLQGTHRGVSGEHLQVYLDEYTFRFNRRRTPMAAFQTLLGLQSNHQPTTYDQIIATGPSAPQRT
jgi:transposase-like protein